MAISLFKRSISAAIAMSDFDCRHTKDSNEFCTDSQSGDTATSPKKVPAPATRALIGRRYVFVGERKFLGDRDQRE